MKKTTKVWLMIATSLILVGCILAKLFMVKYETTTYEVSKDFSDISISTDTADIIFALSDDGTCKVECYEEENAKHSVTVENDVLIVKTNKSWYDYIGYSFGWSKITIYLTEMLEVADEQNNELLSVVQLLFDCYDEIVSTIKDQNDPSELIQLIEKVFIVMFAAQPFVAGYSAQHDNT